MRLKNTDQAPTSNKQTTSNVEIEIQKDTINIS